MAKIVFPLAVLSLWLTALPTTPSLATVTITSISGNFSNPVTSGVVLNPNGTTTAFDNASSAEAAFDFGGSVMRWGSGSVTPAPGFAPSALVFLPAPAPGVVSDGQTFLLGLVQFANGNSELEKLIFGSTLTITASSSAGGPVDPLVLDVDIDTTLNFVGDEEWSADFFRLSGFGLAGDVTLHAYENSGNILTAELYGSVVGDPMLRGEVIQLAPGQQGIGFAGSGPTPAPAVVPEATTAAVWLIGGPGAAWGLWRFRRRQAD